MNPSAPRCAVALAVALLAAAAGVLAQAASPPPPPPPDSEPLPEIPPPPEIAGDPDLEPQVTITQQGRRDRRGGAGQRQAGLDQGHAAPRPALFPDSGRRRQTFIRRDSLDTGLKVPLWLLFEF